MLRARRALSGMDIPKIWQARSDRECNVGGSIVRLGLRTTKYPAKDPSAARLGSMFRSGLHDADWSGPSAEDNL